MRRRFRIPYSIAPAGILLQPNASTSKLTAMKLLHLAATLLIAMPGFARAEDKGPTPEQIAAFQRVMKTIGELQYQTGEIPLIGGKAKLHLTPDFQFLDSANARKVLVDIWHNPPEVASTSGMIVPKGSNFLAQDSWAVILQWKEDGYVKDSDFDTLDFGKMLKELQEGSAEASQQRIKDGYGKMELAGWAAQPHYDRATHKLYYAKNYDTEGPVQQLNYDIRILGRAGVFEMSILASTPQLAEIEARAPAVLGMLDFTDGNRYADYKSGDKTAAYGIAALIAGGVAAKAGLFKVIALFFVKFAKVIMVGIAALIAGVAKLFGRKKSA